MMKFAFFFWGKGKKTIAKTRASQGEGRKQGKHEIMFPFFVLSCFRGNFILLGSSIPEFQENT
jgi:hypothetical protein